MAQTEPINTIQSYRDTGRGSLVGNIVPAWDTNKYISQIGFNPAPSPQPEWDTQMVEAPSKLDMMMADIGSENRDPLNTGSEMANMMAIQQVLQNAKSAPGTGIAGSLGNVAGAGAGAYLGYGLGAAAGSIGGPAGMMIGSAIGSGVGGSVGSILDFWLGAGDRERERREARERKKRMGQLEHIATGQMRAKEARANDDWQFTREGQLVQRAQAIAQAAKQRRTEKLMKQGQYYAGRQGPALGV